MPDTTLPAMSSRRSRDARSGVRSTTRGSGTVGARGPGLPRARPDARADQGVDLLRLAHDDVLEPVLQRLRPALLARGRDDVLERLDGLGLGVDHPLDERPGIAVGLDRRDLHRRLAAERRDLLDQMASV